MSEKRDLLVTGGCGYLGSQLLRDLPERVDGVETVHVLDNMQKGEYRALMDLPETGSYVFWETDVMDQGTLRTILSEVDAVVHLAAVVQTPLSFNDPNWVEQVNHWGTSHLVEACIEKGVSDFIFASSASVYGPGTEARREDDRCEPMGAYAESKHKAERVVASASRRGLRTVTLRIGTLLGPAPVTRFESVANRFASLAGTSRTLTVYGDGEQTRPFVNVADASDAICWCCNQRDESEGQVYNVHNANASIVDLVRAVRSVLPDVSVRRTEQDIRTHLSFAMSGEKIREVGWSPTSTLEECIGALLDLFQQFESSSATRRMSA
jgi:nucleoside-diphosphate-sugar epimerase